MKAIVLAAGRGTRMHSSEAVLPKALRDLEGRPLIRYVLDNLNFIAPEDTAIVVGYLGDMVREAVGGAYRFVEQPQPYDGTAHATLAAREIFGEIDGPVLVCYCDMPFLTRETYQMMFDAHCKKGAGNTVLAGIIDPPPPFGRLIYDAAGNLVDIVEESAATPAQRRITEVNIGIQVIDGARMWGWLDQVGNDNPKGEYYLTGLAHVLGREGVPQAVVYLDDLDEALGINTLEDLAQAKRMLNEKNA